MAKTRQMQRTSNVNKARTRGAKKLARYVPNIPPSISPAEPTRGSQSLDSVENAVPRVHGRSSRSKQKAPDLPPQPINILLAGLALLRDYSADAVQAAQVDEFIEQVDDASSKDELRKFFGAIMGAEDDAKDEENARLVKRIEELKNANNNSKMNVFSP